MATDVQQLIETKKFSPEEIAARAGEIYDTRATVLVEDSSGVRSSNGKHYAKFYVPVGMLEPVEE